LRSKGKKGRNAYGKDGKGSHDSHVDENNHTKTFELKSANANIQLRTSTDKQGNGKLSIVVGDDKFSSDLVLDNLEKEDIRFEMYDSVK
jgi:hypothetical protein